MLDLRERRLLLNTIPNPSGRLDYVVSIEGSMDLPAPHGSVTMSLRYIPDRDVLNPDCLALYYREISGAEWGSLEEVAVTLLDDINNEVVPRWLSVALLRRDMATSEREKHGVVLEDRQPRWDNPRLLNRLERL